MPDAVVRRAPARIPTYRRTAIFAVVLSVAIVTFFAWALLSFRSTLTLSHAYINAPAGANYEIIPDGRTKKFKNVGTPLKQPAGSCYRIDVSLPSGKYTAVLLAGSPPKASPTNASCPATKETPLDAPSTTADTISLVVILLMIAGSCVLVVPAVRAVINSGRARKALARGDLVETRVAADRAKIQCWYTFGFGIAIVILGASAVMLWASDGGIRRPFLKFSIMSGKFGTIGDAFLRNVKIFLWTEPFVLVWGLIVAIARLAPGKPGRPVRALATFYVDLFRGVPAVIVIYLLGFGLVTSKLPVVSKLTPDQYAILALTLTYGAYVAEVYRAGIESIHWSQTAAARSLGLSNPATLRHVVVPQAVRRIVPPLLNDFIGLQKDTALVGYIGVLEAFNQSRIINSQVANLSALTVVALLFYVITVPQARMVDWLVRRDQSRMRAGG